MMNCNDNLHTVLLSSLSTFLMLWASTLALEYTYNRLQSDSYFIEYYSVEKIDPPGELNMHLSMQSVGVVRRALDVQHVDILRCQTPIGSSWRYVSEQPASVRYTSPAYLGFAEVPDGAENESRLVSGMWDYRGARPLSKSLCLIEANITVRPSVGVEKRLQLESDPFVIL